MLANSDLVQALECVRDIITASNHDQFIASLIRVMHPLMRAAVTGYNEADPVRKRFTFVIHPREIVSDRMIQAWVQHARENPLIQHVQNNPGDFGVYKITDFMPQHQFRKTALCRKTYREMGAEYQIAMPFPIAGSAAIAIVFNRANDFTERDRELLTLLQPIIFTAYCNVQKMTDLELWQEETKAAAHARAVASQISLGNLGLSAREKEVLRQIVQGKGNKQIAVHLKLSIRTIEKYVEHLLRKLKVPTRAAACAKFLRLFHEGI